MRTFNTNFQTEIEAQTAQISQLFEFEFSPTIYYTDCDINVVHNEHLYSAKEVSIDRIEYSGDQSVDTVRITIDNVDRTFSTYLLASDKRGTAVYIKAVAFKTEEIEAIDRQWVDVDSGEAVWVADTVSQWATTLYKKRRYVETIFKGELDQYEFDEKRVVLSIVSPWIRWRKRPLRTLTPNCPLNFKKSQLMGYWPFDEGSSTTVADKSGYDNDGTITNATFSSTAKVGYSLLFDAHNEYVTVTDSADLDNVAFFAISCWIYPTSHAYTAGIISKDETYYLSLDTNGKLGFSIDNDAALITPEEINIPLNSWTHVLCVFDGSLEVNYRKKIYINGVLVVTGSASSTIQGTAANLIFGKFTAASTYSYQGYLDEVRLFRIAPSATQAWKIYTHLDYFLAASIEKNCPYYGSETTCDRAYDRCAELLESDNFSGFRWLTATQEKEIYWGGYGPDKGNK